MNTPREVKRPYRTRHLRSLKDGRTRVQPLLVELTVAVGRRDVAGLSPGVSINHPDGDGSRLLDSPRQTRRGFEDPNVRESLSRVRA